MALPTRDDILSGQFSYDGSPLINVAAKSGIDLDSLEFSYDGSPFWGAEVPAAGGGIYSLPGTPWSAVSKVGGVNKANIAKIGGVENV